MISEKYDNRFDKELIVNEYAFISSDRIGAIRISEEVLIEIFQKLLSENRIEFLDPVFIGVVRLSDLKSYDFIFSSKSFNECVDKKKDFIEYLVLERNLCPTEDFRMQRKITKAVNEVLSEKHAEKEKKSLTKRGKVKNQPPDLTAVEF